MLPLPSAPPPPSIPPAASATATDISGLVISVGIIALAALTMASFHLLYFLLSRRRTPSAVELPAAANAPHSSHWDQLISSLPFFSLASPAVATSTDCAVCLSPFRPPEEPLLLPNCRHTFHLRCINTWLQSTPSCPLCRSSVPLSTNSPPQGSGLHTELGSVSRRRIPNEVSREAGGSGAVIGRSYSLESSVEYLVGDEVERVGRRMGGEKESGSHDGGDPAEEVAEADGIGWLRECFVRVASSASSSFSSLRFSSRFGSQRFDSAAAAAASATTDGDGRSWDTEGVEWVEESGLAGIYRWLVEI